MSDRPSKINFDEALELIKITTDPRMKGLKEPSGIFRSRMIRPTIRQVVYGFYGIGPEDGLTDSTWEFLPNQVFQPHYIMLWPINTVWIQTLQVGTQSQLMSGELSADLWKSDYDLDLMIDRYFDAQTGQRGNGVEYLLGDEMDRGVHGRWVDMPTVEPGIFFSMKFRGKLRAALVIGDEPV